MTKEQIIEEVRQCASKLGHVPSRNELTKIANVSPKQIRWHFGTYTALLRECNLERRGGGVKLDMEALLWDWAGLVRDLRKLPSLTEYEHFSKYSTSPLLYRFGVWAQLPFGMKQYIEASGKTEEMKDVLEVIEAQMGQVRPGKTLRPRSPGQDHKNGAQRRELDAGQDDVNAGGHDDGREGLACEWGLKQGRGRYGALLRYGPMVCEPVNEQGVLFLFGAMAEKLGFALLQIGTAFPDCELFRVLEGGRLERIKAEIEFESRNFLKHLHDAKGCRLIICWEHNWPECPLPVIELKAAVSDQRSALSKSVEYRRNRAESPESPESGRQNLPRRQGDTEEIG